MAGPALMPKSCSPSSGQLFWFGAELSTTQGENAKCCERRVKFLYSHSKATAGLARKALSSLGALEGWVTQAPIRKSGRCGQGGGEASRWRTLRGPVQRREGGCEPQQAAFLLGPDLLGPEGQQM